MKHSIKLFLSIFMLASCSALPESGPTTSAIESKESKVLLSGYQLIDVNENVVQLINNRPHPSLSSITGVARTRSTGVIGIGDIVSATIWEASAGGLFSAASNEGGGAKYTTLPEQQVSANGTISIPYGGSIRVAGLTSEQAGASITSRLSEKAIDPQVLLVVTKSVGSGVTIVGSVGRPGRMPLPPTGGRLLDLLGDASGFTGQAYENTVQLNRGTQIAKIPLSAVIENPNENITLQPGDVITVTREPLTFTVFGATGINSKVPFGAANLSLNEALGLANGLSDLRANARSVFVMRYEPFGRIDAMLPREKITTSPGRRIVPVIYRFNISDPGGFLLANQFAMQNKDIVYISNAPLSEMQKFVTLLSSTVQVPTTLTGAKTGVAGAFVP